MIIDSDTSRLTLGRGELVRIPRSTGMTIAVHSGSVWLTQDRDPRDIVLSPGDSFEIDENELTVVQALETTRFLLLPAVGRPAQHGIPEAKPFAVPDEWTAAVRGWMPALPRNAF